jgi:hypothetical protein
MAKPVEVLTRGRAASYALALNFSLGGLLLGAAPPLPVGSRCQVAIPPAAGLTGDKILLEGTVVRSDVHGTAVQFTLQLGADAFEAIARQPGITGLAGSLTRSYLNYFKVSQHKDFQGSQELLGVSPALFRTVFLATFATCIPLAILPVWAVRDSLGFLGSWVKVLLCFGYAAVWFALVQPFADLLVFSLVRKRSIQP